VFPLSFIAPLQRVFDTTAAGKGLSSAGENYA
jgi:hypothetical protein